MGTPPSQATRSSSFWPVFIIFAVAVLATVVWLKIPKNQNDEPTAKNSIRPAESKKFTRDESLKLIDLRNQAIGYLENHDFSKADAALRDVLPLTPNDPFVTRNLAICRQLALKAIDKQRDADQFQHATHWANDAIKRAIAAEPKSFIPHVIAARVAETLDQIDDAIAKLQEARRLDPEAVGPAYDLYQLSQLSSDPKVIDEGFEAIHFVFQKEPHNLFVMKDWLPLVAKRHGPELIEALHQAKETIEPFAESIKLHTQRDVGQILNAALTAANEGKWPVAERSITMLKNLVLPESARDSRFVKLDSLEYLVPDFNDSSRSRLDLPPTQVPVSRPIHFTRPHDSTNWPTVAGCRDFAVTDFDLDGRLDLVILQTHQLSAWGRRSDDQTWTTMASAHIEGSYTGVLAFDFDDDIDQEIVQSISNQKKPDAPTDPETAGLCHTADPDAILFGPAGLKLLENKRDFDSESDTRSLIAISGGEAFDAIRDVLTATAADIDSDGDLDLIVATTAGVRVFSNRGNLTFEDISGRSVLPPKETQIAAMAIVDWDRDADIDIVLATPTGCALLENFRRGRLRYHDLKDLSALREPQSIQIEDFNGDGSWDVAAAGKMGAIVTFSNRTSAGLVSARQSVTLTSAPVRSLCAGDFDNDGVLDLLALKDDGVAMWRGDGASGFTPDTVDPQATDDWRKKADVISVADFDRDGDLDLIVAEPTGIHGWSNQCRESDNPDHGWLELRLVSERVRPTEQNWDRRTNHVNLGGLIEVKAGERYQARTVSGAITHFGLGKQRHADVARILWTNGIPTNVIDPAADVSVCIEQKLGGSCPYLYTWNGKRFEFVTDLLWNAPLGLLFAENVVAPWREWEYLKIDGRQLKADQNEYQLRITAELWEAEYFDQVKLFAIDHPTGTEIFTNEKVGPAPIAEHHIHTVRSPRPPVAAKDTKGRDVLPKVIARDGNYTKTFDQRIAQGFTEEHFLELDLGEFPQGKRVTLFLTGWLYPGSTSLRVQLSQNPDLRPSKPPAIHTPDAQGHWREVLGYMGFPGGKTKTIAIDVSSLFTGDDHRLRIVSTMELFWDAAFFTVDEQPVEVRQTELKLVRAEARDRGGVSARSWPASGNGPDQFDYAQLVPGPAWPAIDGNFTRFGNVLPLLIDRDDQLVVTGSGDEIQLSFAEPRQSLEPGWVRDFVIYTVGWDKDADQNTIYGDCVEPLPFAAMTVYALQDGEPRPLDPDYVKYLATYQTRKQNPASFWNSIQRSRRN